MATVNIHEAKTSFSRLVARAAAGERIVIAKAGVPQAMLVPFDGRGRKRVPGMDKGKIIIHPNFDDPLPEFDPDYMHPGDPMRDLMK
jgi:prevent-host-death family protein